MTSSKCTRHAFGGCHHLHISLSAWSSVYGYQATNYCKQHKTTAKKFCYLFGFFPCSSFKLLELLVWNVPEHLIIDKITTAFNASCQGSKADVPSSQTVLYSWMHHLLCQYSSRTARHWHMLPLAAGTTQPQTLNTECMAMRMWFGCKLSVQAHVYSATILQLLAFKKCIPNANALQCICLNLVYPKCPICFQTGHLGGKTC